MNNIAPSGLRDILVRFARYIDNSKNFRNHFKRTSPFKPTGVNDISRLRTFVFFQFHPS